MTENTPQGWRDMTSALESLFASAWMIGSCEVKFDSTVLFGKGYCFEGLENAREEFAGELGWAVVWPEDWPTKKRWRYYCQPDGVMNTVTYSEQDAKWAAACHVSPALRALLLPTDTGFADSLVVSEEMGQVLIEYLPDVRVFEDLRPQDVAKSIAAALPHAKTVEQVREELLEELAQKLDAAASKETSRVAKAALKEPAAWLRSQKGQTND